MKSYTTLLVLSLVSLTAVPAFATTATVVSQSFYCSNFNVQMPEWRVAYVEKIVGQKAKENCEGTSHKICGVINSSTTIADKNEMCLSTAQALPIE